MFRFASVFLLRLQYIFIATIAVGFVIAATIRSPGLGIFLILLFAWKRNHQPLRLSTAHGSARWAGFIDLKQAGLLTDSGLILGRFSGASPPSVRQTLYALYLWPVRASSAALDVVRQLLGAKVDAVVRLTDRGIPHLAAFAASGQGKSTCFVIPNLLNDSTPAFVLDPKGELFQQTAEYRAEAFGHEIVRIDAFNIAPSERFPAHGFNPFSLSDASSPLAVDDARRLANALVVPNPNANEQFWDKSAQIVIQAVILFLFAKARGAEATLNSLRDILCSPTALKQAIRVMQDAPEFQGILARMAGQLRSLQGKTRASTLAVVNTHLDFLDSLPVAATLAATTFNARKLLDGKMTIYLCLPIDRIQEFRGLQRVILTSLINMIFQAGESRDRRIRFYLDEAATLSEIEPLYSALVFGRSFGIRLFFLFQSISQVELCFPKSKADDFRATVASIYGGTNDFKTAQEISQWIGQTAAHSYSSQTSRNWGGSTTAGSHDQSHGTSYGYSTSQTVNETARALIRPEEVLQLSTDEALVLLPHVRPLRVLKMPYYMKRRRTRSVFTRFLEFIAVSLFSFICLMFLIQLYDRAQQPAPPRPAPSPRAAIHRLHQER